MYNFNDLPKLVGTLLESNKELLIKVDELNRKVEGQKEKPILSRKEVQELFSIHYNSIPNWEKDGLIKPYYMGSKPYYKREEVLAFIYTKNKAG